MCIRDRRAADDELRALVLAYRHVERDPNAINLKLESFFEDFDGAVAAVPNFGHWFNDPAKGLNDRAFYGGRAYAEHWATARFPQADAYAAAHGNKLHSESFMLWLLRDVPVELKPICFLRVRATGRIMERDCDGGHTGYRPTSPLPQRRSQI